MLLREEEVYIATLRAVPTRHHHTEQFSGILMTNTYLALTSRRREGWEKNQSTKGTQTASYCNNSL